VSRPVLSTYRLQLHPGFTFAHAADLVPQLAELGVSHLYLSPVLEAVPGSTHGYDVVDPTHVRGELGGEEGLRALAATAHEAGLGLVLDIVPNHVGLVSPVNPWWWDTLAHGPDGRYGRHLDVHWRPGAHDQPTLLLPELGRPLDEELAGTDLALAHEPSREPAWSVVYHEHAWPVAPGTLEAIGLDPTDVSATSAAVDRDRGLLAALLDRQHYRLAHWRRANAELDHRRFFDVDTLGAVRIEDPEVFADAHSAVLPLLRDGVADGLRIDHPDGLADPVGYLHRLREAVGPDVWIVVEKILEHGERFRDSWPIDGTVGYEFADLELGVHVDAGAAEALDGLQTTLTGAPMHRAAAVDEAKRTALTELFGAERARLVAALRAALPAASAPDEDEADDLLTELLVAWPVYRTYVRPEDGVVTAQDREIIGQALALVRAHRPELSDRLDAVGALLRLGTRSDAADRFVTAFQQLTGPAIAKGLEDTVLYRDLRFVAVNEVGGDPGHLGRHVGQLHAANADAQAHRPATMRLSSTHDTKRSEDVRARLAVLSQEPDTWVRAVLEASELLGERHPGRRPDGAHEHLALQTAVGAWPIDESRLAAYLVKAAREGKQWTDWLEPDEEYEAAIGSCASTLTRDERLVAHVERVVDRIVEAGRWTSLAMLAAKLTAPGVPDTYQGTELWELTLVDPDNRRDVDHELRARLLAELRDAPSPAELLDRADEGLPKLWLIRQALRLRRERPDAFGPAGAYRPLWPVGERSHHVAAFVRGDEVATILPLQVLRLGDGFAAWDWGDTSIELPAGTWADRLTGRTHEGGHQRVADLLAAFPVAVLAREA
jgi:(1->4)-alpha-D-glucan 1-alpha-D-glucosylmutase